MESLTKAARNTVNLKKGDFTVGDEQSGILLLKVIMAKSQVDTRARINLLMGKLYSGMSDMMAVQQENAGLFITGCKVSFLEVDCASGSFGE
jgi:hypothetical protein